MKKAFFILSFLSLYVWTFSQTNKPDVGGFGIKVGVSIPNIGLGLTFSRQLKSNLEFGASAGFSFSTSKSRQVTTQGFTTINGWTNGNYEYTQRYFSYAISVSPFLVYHFPINNNLDVFAGGRLLFSVGRQINYTNTHRYYTANYESKNTSNIRFPFSFGAGAGVLLGADYYFRKNMAVGVSGNIGFTSLFQSGTQTEKVIQTNSGTLNPIQGTTYSEQKRAIKSVYTNTGLNGSVGVNFTFYFARQRTKKSD